MCAYCCAQFYTRVAPSKPPGEREIGGDQALLTWVSSFATYVAVVAEVHPKRVGDMLAYMRLIVREASKFGGNGWLTYDSVFRRNQEGLSTPWNASLHQVYIANQGVKVATPCKHCHEVDHVAADCAITAVLPQVTNTTSSVANTVPPTSTPERGSSKGKRSFPYTRQRPICTSWNGGKLHVCSCVCQLLWQPSSLSLSRKALLQCSHSREAGHPSSKGTMTG